MDFEIIAEIGVNHNGDIDLAKKLIDVAADNRVEYVKFQTFKSSSLVANNSELAEYQKSSGFQNQNDLLSNLELKEQDFQHLNEYCKLKGIKFLSTAFDLESLKFLLELGIDAIKIPSGEITNYPYLKYISNIKGKRIFLSTGMATLQEVNSAYSILTKNKGINKEDITVFQCTSMYPCPKEHANINILETYKNLGYKIGFSDHTDGILAAQLALSKGARLFEKHITLDRSMSGPDHKASLNPEQFEKYIEGLKTAREILGSYEKKPVGDEDKNSQVVRKSICSKKDIKKGEKFTEENITVLRPGNGLSPMLWENIIGKPSKNDIASHELINQNDY